MQDIAALVEKLGPFLAAVIAATVAGYVSVKKQGDDSRQVEWKYLQEERKRLQEYIDEQLDEMKSERSKLIEELGKTRERVAVLEDHIKKLEYSKNQAINRLRKDNETLRSLNTQLMAENAQLRAS